MGPGVSIIPDVLGSLASLVIAVPPGSHPGYPFGLEEYVTDEEYADHLNACELYVEFPHVWIEKSI